MHWWWSGERITGTTSIIRSYIEEVKPVLIGVDGGGDALLEFGLVPDIIIGDMDSVSDRAQKMQGNSSPCLHGRQGSRFGKDKPAGA